MIGTMICLLLLLDYLANKCAYTLLLCMIIYSIALLVIGFPISILKVIFTAKPAKTWPSFTLTKNKNENNSKTD